MIVDIHTHVGEYEKHYSPAYAQIFGAAFNADPHEMWTIKKDVYLKDFNDAGVDMMIVHGMDYTRVDPGTKLDDEYIYEEYVTPNPGRIYGFSAIQAVNAQGRFCAKSLAQFKKAITEYGFKGLKMHPMYSQYAPDAKEVYPFYQAASEFGVPALLHMGATGYTPATLKYGNPEYLDSVARDFPAMKICAAHLAYGYTTQLYGLMRKCPNVYTDISAQNIRPVELTWHLVLAKEYGLLKRVMWGTDYPCCKPATFINWLRTGLNETAGKSGWPTFTDQEIEDMLGNNALEFLGMKQSGGKS